ncbi:hypothetical protein DMN91_012979 [Ooceraea biroi]|uniref:Uncharacterized protein n=1 Tax=Ooceraea biroi TaxID=2015173 RepID=A0A3L8D3K9_OOCBI|nr:hypothetical protein DMN91_012979 [Ooceraea biroi]
MLTQSSPLQEKRHEIHDHHSNLSPEVIPQSFSPDGQDIEAISDSPTKVVENSGTAQSNYILHVRTTNHYLEFGLVQRSFNDRAAVQEIRPACMTYFSLGLRTITTTVLHEGEPELPHISPVPVDPAHDVAAFKMDLMGANLDSAATGPFVHDLIAKTWSTIMVSGLPKEMTLALCKKYPVPQNLQFAKTPTLNTEVKQVMPSTSVKRDDYQVITQGMIEAAISAQAHLVSELLKPEEQWDGKRIFELASDTGRLLSHIHHVSKNRRAY